MATKAERFDTAFSNARKRGAKTFTFEGKKYSTETAEEEVMRGEYAYGIDRNRATPNWKYLENIMKERQKPDGGADMSRGEKIRADAGIKALDAANKARKRPQWTSRSLKKWEEERRKKSLKNEN